MMKRIGIFVIAAAILLPAFWAFYHQAGAAGLGPGAPAPALKGGPWLGGEGDGKPLRLKDLRGKVVLIDMWTFA